MDRISWYPYDRVGNLLQESTGSVKQSRSYPLEGHRHHLLHLFKQDSLSWVTQALLLYCGSSWQAPVWRFLQHSGL